MSVQPAKAQFEALLDFLKRTRGFDFSGYKRSTLMRRIGRRLQATGVDSFEDYMDYLEVHPDEFTELFDTILINVTGFFRDPEAWQFLATQVLPGIAQGERSNEGVRVWCAGCSTGEEAYTTAMVLAEAMGDEQFRERVKVYATDVDEAALNDARVASYTNKQLESVPADLRKKYFEPFNGRLVFRKHLRRSIIFGRHDLLRDAPISRINLLVCRNVLMYFNAEAQARILAHFHFARKETGYLFLGKAEMLLTHPELFTPLDLKRRVFTKATATRARDRTLLFGQAFAAENNGERPAAGTLLESVFELGREPQLVAAPNETLLLANEQARTVFGLAARDFGRPLRELSVGYRPVELVPLLDQAVATRRPGHARSIEWRSNDGASRYFDLNVLPLRTRSCSRASKSWRRPTKSSSRPTKSSKR